MIIIFLKKKKSQIREPKNLSTDVDSRANTILERLRDLFLQKFKLKLNWEMS